MSSAEITEGWYTCRKHGRQDRYVIPHDETRVKYKQRDPLNIRWCWRYVSRKYFWSYYERRSEACTSTGPGS